MKRVSDAADIGEAARAALLRVEEAVQSRLGYRCAYNARTGELFVYLRDMSFGIHAWPVRQSYGVGRAPAPDDVVGFLQRGRLGRWRGQLMQRMAAQSAKSRRESELQRWMDDVRPSAVDHASYLLQKQGMGRRWRKSAVVSGAKES